MEAHEASEAAMRAYCLHPLFQSDDDLRESSRKPVDWIDPLVMLYTMEYRRAANAYLCRPHTDAWTIEDLKLYVGYIIPEVRIMLIADKVQNQKDFLIHHHGTHPRSDQLDRYFQNWLLFVRGY